MEQYGVVLKTEEGLATVKLQRHLTCENCGRCGILSGSDKRELIVKAINQAQAKTGQRVMMETDHRQVLFISFMLYIVPLMAFVASIVVSYRIVSITGFQVNNELLAIGFGLLAMTVVYLLIRIWDKRVRNDHRYKPVITGLVDSENREIEGERNGKEI